MKLFPAHVRRIVANDRPFNVAVLDADGSVLCSGVVDGIRHHDSFYPRQQFNTFDVIRTGRVHRCVADIVDGDTVELPLPPLPDDHAQVRAGDTVTLFFAGPMLIITDEDFSVTPPAGAEMSRS